MAALELQIIAAVQKGDINAVRTLIENGANINVFTSGKTPLGIAAHQGNVPLLELLLNCGQFKQCVDRKLKKKGCKNDVRKDPRMAIKKRKAVEGNNGYYEVIYDDKSDESESDVNKNVSIDEAETPEGMDNLEWDAELNGDDDSDYEDAWSDQYRWYAKILANTCHQIPSDLPYSCDVNLQDSVRRCAIHYAAEHGHENAVKLLLNAGCKADIGDMNNLTPLHLAASGGHQSVVATLLSSGCQVNAKTTDKLSPLHYAAVKGHTEVVSTLLDAGAHIDSLDEGERTPLMLAVSRNLPDVVDVLIKRGAKVNIEDVKGYTAMCEAVWQKSVPMVRMLVKAGAKVIPTNYLLHYAVFHRQPEMVVALLDAGALVNIRDSWGDTPLIAAAISAQPDMVNLLIARGALVDYSGGNSEKTPLHCAVTMSVSSLHSPRVLRLLVEAGADIERDTWGQTPLTCALVARKERLVVSLVSLGAQLKPMYSPLVMRDDSIAIPKVFAYAGYNLQKMFPTLLPPENWPSEITTGTQWLTHAKYNPLSLAELSRIVVRSQALGVMSHWISSLKVPPIIKGYLMFDDVMESIEACPEPEDIPAETRWRCCASPGSESSSYSDEE